MKKLLISLAFLCFIFTCCFGQNKEKLQMGLHLNFRSLQFVEAQGRRLYKHFRTISPGITLAFKRHKVGVSLDLMASHLSSRWAGIKRDEPKGLSTDYLFTLLNWHRFSAKLGIQARMYEYFDGYSYGVGISHISQSRFYHSGNLFNIKQIGPQIALGSKWENIELNISLSLLKAKYRRYSLTVSREYSGLYTFLDSSIGIRYWIIR